MPAEREIRYWDCRDGEDLTHTDRDAAIEDFLSDVPGPVPQTLEVSGYAPMELPELSYLHDRIRDYISDVLLDEYADPEEPVILPESVTMAIDLVARLLHHDYTPWSCDLVRKETVDVAAWVREHRPDWIDEETTHD
jgi:hypothetical protein